MRDPVWIDARMPVWSALSDLFLDTELDENDHRRIATAIAAAGLDAAEARAILKDEVLPAFAFNLMQVAGEWAGWSDADIRAIMVAALPDGCGLSFGARIKQYLLWRDLASEWNRIAALID